MSSPVLIRFGLAGMGVAPANHDGGDAHRNTGHRHLLVNTPPLTGDALRTGIPADDNQHTLQLVFGDRMHVPQNPPAMSARITITVR